MLKKTLRLLTVLLSLGALTLASGCATPGGGALLGGGVGALIGAGLDPYNPSRGAAIGAGLGGLTGFGLSNRGPSYHHQRHGRGYYRDGYCR